MKIECGAPAASKRTWIVGIVICLGLCGWFFWDYRVGYPNKNREEARKHFAGLGVPDPKLSETLDEATYGRFRASSTTTPQTISQELGAPIYSTDEGGGITAQQYASIYGLMTVRTRVGAVTDLKWQPWGRKKSDIEGQLYFALGCLGLALYPAFRLFKTMTLRVLLDDDGLTYDGRRIAFDDMRGLKDYDARGWVDLVYVAGGSESKLRLDNQRVDRFDEIVTAIAEKRGYPNPLGAQG